MSISKRSLSFESVRASPGAVRGRVGCDDLNAITAVGNECGVEAVGFVGDVVFEQVPIVFAVAAEIERVDEVVAVFIVRGPANGDGGAVFDGWKRRAGAAGIDRNDEGWFAEGKLMLTVCFGLGSSSAD